MFGKQRRRHHSEQIAGQAWDQLASAVGTAESSIRSARKRAGSLYDDTTTRIGEGGREARARAHDAYDALLGRRRRGTSWGWLATAAATGVVAGWVVTTFGRRALADSDELRLPSPAEDLVQTDAHMGVHTGA